MQTDGSDPHVALLMYRATPLKSLTSPAKLLNQRRFHTTLPATNKMSQQQKQARKKMQREESSMTEATYNKRARQYRELSQHEPVYVQLDPNQSRWQRATITRTPPEGQPQNYEVQLPSSATYSRNRKFIRPGAEKSNKKFILKKRGTFKCECCVITKREMSSAIVDSSKNIQFSTFCTTQASFPRLPRKVRNLNPSDARLAEIEDINKEKIERQIVTVPKQRNFNPINLNLDVFTLRDARVRVVKSKVMCVELNETISRIFHCIFKMLNFGITFSQYRADSSSPDGLHSDNTPHLMQAEQGTPSSHNGDRLHLEEDPNESPRQDRNPEPPKELEDDSLIDADNIKGTVFSQRWLFTTLMNLIRVIEGQSESKEGEGKEAAPLDLDDNLQDELCKLWDMSMSQEVVNFLMEYKAVDILTSIVAKSNAPRATLLSNTASFVDQIMDTDMALCQKWSTSELISALLEAFKQTENESCQLYQELLHIIQLISTTEEGVETMMEHAEALSEICLQYLRFLCAEDVIAFDGCENTVASAVSVMNVILTSWPGRDHLLVNDFQLIRCILKIQEVVYLRFHKLDVGPRVRSKSHCTDNDVVDLTEDSVDGIPPPSPKDMIQISDDSSDGEKSQDREDVSQQVISMLYETLQSFILDLISALAELSELLPEDKEISGDDSNERREETALPKSFEYLNCMCDQLRIQFMVYTAKDFEGDTDGLIEGFQDTAKKYQLHRLAKIIFQSYHREDRKIS
ncbi:hypothetical protein CAPTEDRAFT_199065 [Capitella teleta]|uniref:Uncharacterized protein n=1 Tax=Capitella teleta TaxID=283909 RepID=R7UMS4_CAPTE|nr:hypothetical protein CAPTEDRAFT_199065 [Capitella teleta]|eukprot:ELU07398.1 hypothetical protein CAPTEDRAFT_199065 [Capitella teleta]